MSRVKKTLLHGLLLSALAVMPVSAFGAGDNSWDFTDYNGNGDSQKKTEQPKDDDRDFFHTDQTAARFQFGAYYGSPYRSYYGYGRQNYYRPYSNYYPYRPYYYHYYNYPYRYNYYYNW